MNFRTVFIAIVFATGLIVAAYLVNSQRPRVVVEQPNADFRQGQRQMRGMPS